MRVLQVWGVDILCLYFSGMDMEKITVGQRPQSIAKAAGWVRSGACDFRMALAEFLDEAKRLRPQGLEAALAEEPALLSPSLAVRPFWQDAYLAAVAEHLSLQEGVEPPAWTDKAERFLNEAFFDNSGLVSLNALLLTESPLSFRRRNIFTELKPLRRA